MNQGRARVRWSNAEARKMLDAWKASGQSLESFAKAHGFSAQRLSYWRKRVSAKESQLPSNLVPALVTLPAAAAIIGIRSTDRVADCHLRRCYFVG